MKSNNFFKYPLLESTIPNFKNLTELQQSFFQMMHSTVNTGGCVLMSGDPGIGKTAIIRDMCKTLGYQYIDIRLTHKDESEVGLFPKVDNIDNQDCVKEIPPYWAITANRKPTIVIFEELNRVRREIQNAALQILMEREIGYNFKFNDNVYFIATSNMNDSHIEDFSTAMRGRLIHYEYEFDFEYWLRNYALHNINPIILEWISSNKNLLTEGPDDDGDGDDDAIVSYLSPRSLSAFSKSLVYVLNHEKDIDNIIKYTETHGNKFIGNKSYSLLEFLRKWTNINVDNILSGFDTNEILKLNREHILYLIEGLKTFVINNLNDGKLSEIDKHINIIKFLKINENSEFDIIDQDIIIGFLNFILDRCDYRIILSNDDNTQHINILKQYLEHFKEEIEIIEKSKISQIL